VYSVGKVQKEGILNVASYETFLDHDERQNHGWRLWYVLTTH